jgi:Tfp pilus assembly protein PilF
MKSWIVSLFSLFLAACGTSQLVSTDSPSSLFNDQLFAPPSEHVGADRIFTTTPEMQRFMDTQLAAQVRAKGPQQALVDALFSESQLKLKYDSAMTRTASEAFESRSANCLSMAIMTAALAKQIGLQVQFRRVYVNEEWSRLNNIYFSTGHVNITLIDAPSHLGLGIRRTTTIDFIPEEELRHYDSEVLDEETIVAMYMNNRAAESIAAGRIDNAYWWAREAIRQDASLEIAYNTLGVIYKTHGNPAQAEKVFRHALEMQPKDIIVMSNLAHVLGTLGRTEESLALAHKVEMLRPAAPFYYFNKGMEAMNQHDYKLAKSLFRKELDRTPDYHEFQYWFAMACLGLGQTKEAEQYLTLAMENSTTKKDRDIYAAKLDHIKSFPATSQDHHPS